MNYRKSHVSVSILNTVKAASCPASTELVLSFVSTLSLFVRLVSKLGAFSLRGSQTRDPKDVHTLHMGLVIDLKTHGLGDTWSTIALDRVSWRAKVKAIRKCKPLRGRVATAA
jgi:hypothetical protein